VITSVTSARIELVVCSQNCKSKVKSHYAELSRMYSGIQMF